jgi:hypothetical protein
MSKRDRFVKPKTVQLPISGGDWIEVKQRLNVYEARVAMASFIGSYHTDGSRKPNMEMLGMGQVYAYIVDWSLETQDDDGKWRRIEFSLEALRRLDLDTYAEIEKVIEAHVEAIDAEDEARKVIDAARTASGGPEGNAPTGSSASSATS